MVDWAKVEGLQSPKLVYRYGQGIRNTDFFPTQRYSVNSNGGCSLTITQLVIGDSGKFMCKQDVGAGEETRTAILVVISVRESCLSNVTNNALAKDDSYSLRCAINVPAKSVEPSNVALSFHNKAVGETETTDEKQWLIVNTTLTGIATKENITRVCRASFPPNTQADYDKTTVTLDVCTTQWIASHYPVENVAVSPLGPYYKGDTVRCTANGHPPPTFKWTHLKSGAFVDGASLVIKGDVGDKYTCIATNTVKGRVASQSITIEVSAKPNPVENIAVSSCGPYYKGNTVRCTANGHPPPTFMWTHLKSGAVVGGNMVIKGDVGDNYTCTATNTFKGRMAHQRITFEVTPFPPPPPTSAPSPPSPPPPSRPPPGGLSDLGKIGIGVAIGVGGMLVLCGILFSVLCMRYLWIKKLKTDDKRTNGMEEADSERSPTSQDSSNAPQYEPLNVLSGQDSNAEATQLTTSTNVDVIEQSLSDRATDEDLGHKLNANESSL